MRYHSFRMPGSGIFACFLILFGYSPVFPQESLKVLNGWVQYTDAQNALIHYVSGEALRHVQARKEKVARIQTAEEWKERQRWITQTLHKVTGPFPEKTALNATITGTVLKKDFVVENIVYESMPGYFVTASLFIPAGLKGKKAPAIVYCSGHSAVGYRSYQQVLLNLVKKGFIVFAFDPVGQGERMEYRKPGDSTFQPPTHQHSYVGAQYFINGQSVARNFIWDGIRAIDYLVTRKEVDSSRIGITGRSGGGTQSSYIAAFDDRIKAVAPEDYITSFSSLLRSIGLQDAEQNFVAGLKEGLDMADLLIAKAPRPTLMITTSRDMFAIEGSVETAAEAQRAYKALGAPGHFAMVTDNAGHASTKKNREAMYAFFQKVFSMPGTTEDMEVELLSPEELKVSITGQVLDSYKGQMAFDINKKESLEKIRQLEAVRGTRGYTAGVLTEAKELSGYRALKAKEPIFMGAFEKTGYTIEKFRLETGKGYVIPYLLYRPDRPNGKAVLYLDPAGKPGDTEQDAELVWLAGNGCLVLAPDMAGTGETGAGVFRGDSYVEGVAYNTWFTTVMTGTSITGIHASDIYLLTDILQKDAAVQKVYGLAKRELCPALLHAAALDNRLSAVALLQPYTSYQSIVQSRQYNPAYLYSTVPGAIGKYDLPDLAASLAPRNLLITGPVDACGTQNDIETIRQDLAVIKKAYEKAPSGPLTITQSVTWEQMKTDLKAWLEN
ncbi:MAG: acetylxylan esterase [Chitinophagaceae bacterium]|nr:acetylxylan esterase [Chitinophagaceae bacterium]MCW5927074.1 acetylxylan esterase [Chitinophagaceae bacterium]